MIDQSRRDAPGLTFARIQQMRYFTTGSTHAPLRLAFPAKLAAGFGSLFATIVLASLGNFPYKNWLLLGQVFIFGTALFLFAWSPWFWASWAILLFVGASSMVPMGTTVLQLTVPSEMQGRILSIWYVGAGLMFIGSLPMALVADVLTWPIAMAGGAVIFLLVAALLGLYRPTLRHLKI